MKLYIISGEVSGDLHGANLLRAILSAYPDTEIRYWGGDRMMQAVSDTPHTGEVTMVRHIRDMAFMGFVEVLMHLKEVFGNISLCKKDILEFNPDTVVFIDYPGFNLKMAKFTHARGIRNVYYISPQIWAWKKGRIKSMRRDLDSLCYILPTERKFYAENVFPQAVYVGHPLLDEVERYRHSANVVEKKSDIVALMPGSRRHELKRLLPLMMRLAKRHPEYRFKVTGMTLIGEEFYRQFIPEGVTNVEIVFDKTYDILAKSFAAVVCSGTATLETALFGVPQVVCYQTDKISAAIARRLIANRIKYVSLVNLIADKPVVCELLQDDYNFERLEDEFWAITEDHDRRQAMIDDYRNVVSELGGEGASKRVVDQIFRKEEPRQ